MEKSKKVRLFADLGLLLVALIWGMGFVATKYAIGQVTPLYLMAMRFVIGFIIMFAVFHKNVFRMKRQEFGGAVVVGIFLYLAFASQTIALLYTDAGKNAFLTGTNIVMVPFIVWIAFKKKPDIRSLVAVGICFAGICLLSINSSFGIAYGDLLTLICAFFFACHIVSTGHFASKMDVFALTVVQLGVVAVLSLLSGALFEPLPAPLTGSGLMAILYLGVISTCISFLLQTVGQKYTVATHAALILSMESVFGSIFAVILLGEAFTLKMLLGCGAILTAILVAELRPQVPEVAKNME